MRLALLLAVFVAASAIGYRIIRQVPPLLHTPLMSGMNAVSGVTVLGALSATAAALTTGSRLLGAIAVAAAVTPSPAHPRGRAPRAGPAGSGDGCDFAAPTASALSHRGRVAYITPSSQA